MMEKQELIWLAAETAHEANKAYCEAMGDLSQVPWEKAPEWQRQSAVQGVLNIMMNPNAGPEDSHISWMELKKADGWVWGTEKNPELKKHPCLVPFNRLPKEQQAKDRIFVGVVRSILGMNRTT